MRARVMAVGIAGLVFATSLIALPAAQSAPTESSLATGVTYSAPTIAGPNKLKIVTIDPDAAAVTIDVATAKNTLPGYSRTSSMATAHNALAAINGDFGLSPGRPGHALAEDGALLQTSPLGNDGKNFAIRANEAKAFIGGPQISIDVFRVAANQHIFLDHYNDADPRSNEINGFSAYGGTVADPPSGACSARLLPSSQPGWAPSDAGVVRNYTVDAMACGASRMSLGSSPGAVVIATPSGGSRANEVKALVKNDAVKLTWTFGWPGVLDAIGGSPVLIDNGQIMVSPCSSYLCKRHPRSAVGIKSNGDIMLFQVDGRSSASVGMTLVELAKAMQKRGAVWALNLDGGGSSTMWIKGKGVVNNPSDGVERSVTSALLVLPGADSGEPSGMLSRPVAAPETGSAAEAAAANEELAAGFQAAVHDPASTGGLLDAMANGDVQGGHRLPAGARDLLDAFRAGRSPA